MNRLNEPTHAELLALVEVAATINALFRSAA